MDTSAGMSKIAFSLGNRCRSMEEMGAGQGRAYMGRGRLLSVNKLCMHGMYGWAPFIFFEITGVYK